MDVNDAMAGVRFVWSGVQPPTAQYVPAGCGLMVRSYSSAALAVLISGVLMLPTGECKPFAFTHQAVATRTLAQEVFPLAEGYLLSVSVTPGGAGAYRDGICYVSAEVVLGTQVSGVRLRELAAGYVVTARPLAWPPAAARSPREGPGDIRSIVGTNPAAGAEISETVPTGAVWRLLAVYYTLITSAVAGNRYSELMVDDGANLLVRGGRYLAVPASTTRRFVYAGTPVYLSAGSLTDVSALPGRVMLAEGFRTGTLTSGLQAGDDYAAVQMLVEEWLSP